MVEETVYLVVNLDIPCSSHEFFTNLEEAKKASDAIGKAYVVERKIDRFGNEEERLIYTPLLEKI